MTLQICMACPAHILASTELRAVTNARGTSDNDHSSQADLYPLGHSGLLTGAMGIWNSRDNVFTSAAEPNCAKGACVGGPPTFGCRTSRRCWPAVPVRAMALLEFPCASLLPR